MRKIVNVPKKPITCNRLKNLSLLNIVIVLHLFHTLAALELEKYLRGKVNKLLFIGHPPAHREKGYPPTYRKYERGEKKYEIRPKRSYLPRIMKFLKDSFITILLLLKEKERFDVYISTNTWEILPGIILRKLRMVKKIIYYSTDYAPDNWFGKVALDFAYQRLDKLSAEHADYVWNLSNVMSLSRRRKGIKEAPAIEVPSGYHFESIDRKPVDELNRYHLVYFGFLSRDKGIQLTIECLPELIEEIPELKLIIIGSGPFEKELKENVKNNGVENYVSFMGFKEKDNDVEAILTRCAIGIALFHPVLNTFSYNSDPQKIRAYMACGLPVIVTKVPKSAYDIEKEKAGIAIDYQKEDFINAALKLLKNDELYCEYRKNAIKMASNHTWQRIYNRAFALTPFLSSDRFYPSHPSSPPSLAE